MLKVFLHIPSPPDFLQVCAKKLDLGGGERGEGGWDYLVSHLMLSPQIITLLVEPRDCYLNLAIIKNTKIQKIHKYKEYKVQNRTNDCHQK